MAKGPKGLERILSQMRFLNHPDEFLPAFELALKDAVLALYPELKEREEVRYSVGVEGSFGSHHVSPRGLNAQLVGRLVLVEGIVIKMSLVRPRVVKSVHWSAALKQHVVRYYREAAEGLSLPAVYPTRDSSGNALSTDFGLSEYRDSQRYLICSLVPLALKFFLTLQRNFARDA